MFRYFLHAYVLLIALVTVPGGLRAQLGKAVQPVRLQDTLRGRPDGPGRSFDVHYYGLRIRLFPTTKMLAGANEIHLRPYQNMDSLRLDLNRRFHVDSVLLQGVAGTKRHLKLRRDDSRLWVHAPDSGLRSGMSYRLWVFYRGRPPQAPKPPWQGGFVWSRDSLQRPWIGVACQGIGARTWWPCKDHPQAEPDSIDMWYEVPQPLRAVGNGRLIDSADFLVDDTPYRRFHWRVRHPINLYNVTMNVARYVSIADTAAGLATTAHYHVLDYHRERAGRYFRKEVPQMFEAFTHWFGPYPFPEDGYQLVETPYWGMEHQSAVAYGNAFKKNSYGFDFILIHETAHEYWGNSISAADAGQLWLHESFATYAEALYLEYHAGKEVASEYLLKQRERIKNKVRIFGPQDIAFHNWADNDLYYKGAWMLHTYRQAARLSDQNWRLLLRFLSRRFARQVVDSRELCEAMDRFARQQLKRPLSWTDAFWDAYLHTADIPELQWRWASPSAEQAPSRLQLRWSHSEADFSMPVPIVYDGRTHWARPRSGKWTSVSAIQKEAGKELRWPERDLLIQVQPVR